MATGMNVDAILGVFRAGMERLERLERTPEGRKQLIAEYTAEAKHLRATSGKDLWCSAGGEQNTHVASPRELARRALERAAGLDKQIKRLRSIKDIHEPWSDYMKRD